MVNLAIYMLRNVFKYMHPSILSQQQHTLACKSAFRAQIMQMHTGSFFMRVAQRKKDVSGTAINIEEVGNGPYPILCLLGALGFIESDFGSILSKFTQCRCMEFSPGYGKSRPPNRDFLGLLSKCRAWANELMKAR